MKFFQAVGTCVLALSSLVSAATFTNPLRAKDGADPHISYSGGYYYLMTTTWSDLRITRAKTLGGLKTGETKTVWKDTTASRCCNVWAPELHFLDGAWYIYYSAGQSANLDLQRPHVLKGGANPFDAYTYHAQLTNTWGIDGSIVRFSKWGNHFVWSCITNNVQALCIAPLTAPGKIGATKILSQPTQSWEKNEKPVMEGPAAMYHGGKTYLAYSASYCWTPNYSLGLLTWDNNGDPALAKSWSKSGPLLTSGNGNYGPGHNGFFTSPDGKEIWNVFHATAIQKGACDGNRYTMAQKVNWNANGTPNFGSPLKLGTSLAGPSGE
ncbi:glycoside hydrolase family 43 protein [Cucurbitaria berberidis CBS 394.84]|uniref:Glycoside hydrolase family 43 protein n=1 Tax=Cucurbitaria berberidis CBS 394.84 TaxID=1168544 RepID=A0A9P4LEP0_9PLEO|nr:glycoside hydrolase family 43 protein [Cucurbitaria berberidis CBS 394.84]KAF1851269.1 glycoside hydrolase family 43 protein [Cucurbitaria berberidis CBS 394.84]